MRVGRHAIQRFQIHHPEATPLALLAARHVATELSPDLVMVLLGRRGNRSQNTRYWLTHDFLGIICEHIYDHVIVTYLRLGLQQRDFCRKHFGPKKATPKPEAPSPPKPEPVKAEPEQVPAKIPARRPRTVQCLPGTSIQFRSLPGPPRGRSTLWERLKAGRRTDSTFCPKTWEETHTFETEDGEVLRLKGQAGGTFQVEAA